jgi:ubiquinone/menaquinone biosynthesis C-methylase UbiE
MKINTDERRMYGNLAWLWPLMGQPDEEDWIAEGEQFVRAIREHSRIEAKTLLHLGCGGGKNDYTFKKYFSITGVDISAAMLVNAQRLNPEIEYVVGDMRTARLGRMFDAVIIADSIDYMLTEGDLRAAFFTAFAHLKSGGVFCTYAEVTRERFQQNETKCSTYARGNIDIAFLHNNYDPDPTDTMYESTFVWLIRRAGKLEIETDHHLGGIFPLQTWLELLREVGFEATLIETPFEAPMFVCVKP